MTGAELSQSLHRPGIGPGRDEHSTDFFTSAPPGVRMRDHCGVCGSMDTPMRIVIPIHSFEPGGVERVALNLAQAWRDAGHEVVVVLGRTGGRGPACVPDLDYWRIPTRLGTAHWETPWMIHSLHRYLVQNRADVVFYPGNTYAVVAAAIRLLMGARTPPAMLKVSNALARPDLPRWLRRPYGLWLKLQGRVCDRLIGLSEPMSREIAALTGAAPDRVVTIANPVLTRQRLRDLATLPRSRGRPDATRYVAAGRLVAQKNYPLMLRGFARSARAGDTLTIAGAGPDRDAILRVVSRLGLTGRVRLAGHLGSVDALLAQADAFVLSSDYEGLPGVVVEALAAGLPVLATDCCASMACLVEAGVTGVLVPPGCEHAMARGFVAVRRMIAEPHRARQLAARYEVERSAERFLQTMAELCGRAHQQAGTVLAFPARLSLARGQN